MKRTMKQLVSMLLSAVLTFTLLPSEALATEATNLLTTHSQEEAVTTETDAAETEPEAVPDEALAPGETVEETENPEETEASTEVETPPEPEDAAEASPEEEDVSTEQETETTDIPEETPDIPISSAAGAAAAVTVPTVDFSGNSEAQSEDVLFPNKKVLLIQDAIPWNKENINIDVNQKILTNLAPYDVTTTTAFPKMSISDYSVIIFANDQSIATYTNYARFSDKLEEFAELGGVIVFGAADGGWANGDLSAPLPGDLTKTSQYTYYNVIEDSSHPIVTGQLTDSNSLLDSDLYSYYCSHAYFNQDSLPVGTRVILKEKYTDNPTLIEYPLGRGRVIASGLTWEHNYIYGGTQSNFHAFAAKALDDLYAYALYVSGISNENLDILLNAEIQNSQHLVVVADAKTNSPIEGATVTLGHTSGTSDENGRVWFNDVEAKDYLVTMRADGYQTKLAQYEVQGGDMRYFFLTNKTGTSAYLTGASAIVTRKDKDGKITSIKSYDLMEETVSIGKELDYEIQLYGDWNGHEPGNFALYLGSSYAYSTDGKFTIKDGKCSNSKGQEVDFDDGRIHAQMVTAAGARSSGVELMLYSPKESSGSLFGGDNTRHFSIGKSIGFTIPDNYPVVGNMDFNISLDMIPLTYEVSDGEIKLAIGFTDFAKIKSPKSTWEDYVKQFETVKRTQNLSSMIQAYGGKSGSFTLKKGWDTPELEVVGYAVGKYDETTGEVTNLSGELAVSTGMTYTYSQQFVIGPVPVYFEIGGGFSLKSDSKIEAILVEDGQLVVDNKLTLTPKFTLGGGVGINGALSVGGKGEASLPIVLCDQVANVDDGTIDYFTNVSLAGELKLTASLLFVFNAEKSIAKGEWQILRYYWDTGEMEWFQANALKAFSEDMAALTDAGAYQLLNRSYQTYDQGWYTTQQFDKAPLQDGMTELQAGLLPTSAPQVVQLKDGRALMVFQQDDAARSDINRSCLMYSIYSNGLWSEPKAVWDTGTADAAAALAVGSDGIYVVWQKMNAVLEDSATVETMAAACEIASAKFNPNTGAFENAKYETNDNKLQMLPTIAVGDSTSYFLYVENSDNQLIGDGTETTNEVYAVSMTSGRKTRIYSGQRYVTALAATAKGTGLEAALILDADADLNTAEDTDLFVYQANSLKQLTADNTTQASAQYHEGLLYWIENDGASSSLFLYDGTETSLAVEHARLGVNAKWMQGETKDALVWAGVTEGGQYCLYAMLCQDGDWSEPIEIVTTDAYIKQFSGYLAEDGSWELVATAERGKAELPVLLYTGVKPYLNTAAENIVAIDRDTDDAYYSLSMDFINNSEQSIDCLTVDFVDADGTCVYTRTTNCSIKAGERTKLQFDVDIPMIREYTEYTVYVYPQGEANLEDNAGNIAFGHADLSLSVQEYVSDNISLLSASIFNDSDVKTDATLIVREDDPETGVTVDIVTIKGLEPGTKQVFNYRHDLTQMNFNGQPSKTYYYLVVGTAAEWNLSNNQEAVTFVNPFYSQTGEAIQPTGLKLEAPDPVMLTPDQTPTYQIEAEAEPVGASKWPLEYDSQDEHIVKVDDTGKITAVGEGSTIVTVKLQNTDISKEIHVEVAPLANRKLRIELAETSAPTARYQVKDTYQMQVYSQVSAAPISPELFTFQSEKPEIAQVASDGTVTLLAPGKVTLTAVYQNDPTVKAQLSITVEAQSVGEIHVSYTQDGVTTQQDGLHTTPQALKDSPITLSAVAYAENGDLMENVSYSFSSNNKQVATVDKYGTVKATGKEGTAMILVSAGDAKAAFTLYLYTQYEPVLVSGSDVSLNLYSSTGATFAIQPISNSIISGYSSVLYTKNGKSYQTSYDYSISRVTTDESGQTTYRIYPNQTNLKTNTYYFRTTVNGQTYYTKLKIKVTKQLPTVKVSTVSFNPFYTDQSGTLRIVSDAQVSNVTFSQEYTKSKINRGFNFTALGDGEYQVSASNTLGSYLRQGKKISSINRKYTLKIYFTGYNMPVTKRITVPISYKEASVKLDKSSFQAGGNLSRYTTATVSVKNVGEKAYSNDIQGASLTRENVSNVSVRLLDGSTGLIQLTLPSTLKKSISGQIGVKLGNWIKPVLVNVKVAPSAKTTYKIAETAKLNPALQQTALVGVVSSKGQRIPLAAAELYTDELFRLESVSEGIQITPLAESSLYTKKQYQYKVVVSDTAGTELGELPLNISINNQLPTVTLADKTLYLDVSQRGRIVSTAFNLSDETVELVEMRGEVLRDGEATSNLSVEADFEAGELQIICQQRVAGTYQITVTPVLKNGAELNPVKLTVYANTETNVTAAVKGTLDAMARTTSTAAVTLKVQNNSAEIEQVSIQNGYRSGFEILHTDLEKNVITIGVKSAFDISTGKHTVPIQVYLTDGSKVLANATVTVKASKCTLKKGATLNLYTSAPEMTATSVIKAAKPADERIESIEQVSATDLFTVTDKGAGVFEISVIERSAIKKGTYSIRCLVHTENETTDNPGISYTIKVSVK